MGRSRLKLSGVTADACGRTLRELRRAPATTVCIDGTSMVEETFSHRRGRRLRARPAARIPLQLEAAPRHNRSRSNSPPAMFHRGRRATASSSPRRASSSASPRARGATTCSPPPTCRRRARPATSRSTRRPKRRSSARGTVRARQLRRAQARAPSSCSPSTASPRRSRSRAARRSCNPRDHDNYGAHDGRAASNSATTTAAVAAAQAMVDLRPDTASYSRVSYLR